MSVVVPDVTGLSEAAAEIALVAGGLVLGDTTEAYSATVAEDLVISQSPEAGEDAEDGSAVDVVVSLGTLVPTGVLGTTIDGLRKCIAGSATFQAAVGVDEEADPATAALAFVHAWVMDEAAEPPYAFVGPGRERRERISTAGAYPENGSLYLCLVLPIAQEDKLDQFYEFDNARDAIIAEAVAISAASGYVHIREIELDPEGYGYWSKQESRARGSEAIQAWHEVNWGF